MITFRSHETARDSLGGELVKDADAVADDREISDATVDAGSEGSAGGIRTALGVAYLVAFVLAAGLPFLAFGPTGLLVLVPTALWLATGLRARVRLAGNLTDGVVRWPGLTALISGASSLFIMAGSGGAMAGAWLASIAACGVIEMARARVAHDDNVRAESKSRGPRS
jgi:hypothetical protein